MLFAQSTSIRAIGFVSQAGTHDRCTFVVTIGQLLIASRYVPHQFDLRVFNMHPCVVNVHKPYLSARAQFDLLFFFSFLMLIDGVSIRDVK